MTGLLNRAFEYVGAPVRRLMVLELGSEHGDLLAGAVLPWHGTVLIASLLRKKGFEVEALVEGISRFSEQELADVDALLVHVTAGNLARTEEVTRHIRQSARIPIIGGGGLTKAVPSAVSGICDFIVRGEGEDTIVELLGALNSRTDVREVPGVSFMWEGQLWHTPSRPFTHNLDTFTDMSVIRGYRRMSLLEQVLRRRFYMMTIEASRGCPFSCKFCITPDLYGSYRTRPIPVVIEELRQRLRYSRRVWFLDNLFVVKRAFTRNLLSAIIDAGLGVRGNFTCFLRVENSRDDEMLELLPRAGFRNVYIGFESLESGDQHAWNKKLQLQEMSAAVARFHEHRLRVNASFLAGSDNQCVDDVEQTVEWAIEHGLDFLNLFVLTPIQMKENLCIPRQRLLAPSWDFMNGNYVTFFPARMRPSTLQLAVNDGIRRFYSASMNTRRIRRYGSVNDRWLWPASLFASSLAARQMRRRMRDYVQYLRRIEAPYYGSDERLLEHQLPPNGVTCLPFMDGADVAMGARRRLAVTRASSPSHCSAPSKMPQHGFDTIELVQQASHDSELEAQDEG
ncbi:MAG: radical SAM protein [Myxococcales bacterium]|nr:radical SAM protein [Myxococcales bacterium]